MPKITSSPRQKNSRPSRRGPRATAADVLAIPSLKTLKEAILSARLASGSTDVTQAEVDQAAQALLDAELPPYPTLVRILVGGSNTTVGIQLADWWRRVGPTLRASNTSVPRPETRLDFQLRLLVSQLEMTLREKLQGAIDPLQALIAAAQLGEQHGLKAQLEGALADRDRLREQLQSMVYKVAELEAQLTAVAAARIAQRSALEVGLEDLNASLQHLSTQLATPPTTSAADLNQLTRQVRRLIAGLAPTSRPSGPRPARRLPSQKRRKQRTGSVKGAGAPRRPPRSQRRPRR